MPYLTREYEFRREDTPSYAKKFYQGFQIIENHPIFSGLEGRISDNQNQLHNKQSAALVRRTGEIYVNIRKDHSPDEWAYLLAHSLLHLAFGHFDHDKIPFDENGEFHPALWNKACDIYITRFLADIKFPGSVFDDPGQKHTVKLNDENKIYEYFKSLHTNTFPQEKHILQEYGTNSLYAPDMLGLEHPIVYKDNQSNTYAGAFAHALASSVTETVSTVSGDNRNTRKDTPVTRANVTKLRLI